MYFNTQSKSSWGKVPLSVDGTLAPLLRVLGLLLRPGEVIELRVVDGKRTLNGYFSDPGRLAQAVMKYSRQPEMAYFTVNPVRRDLLAAKHQALRQPASWLAGDRDIIRHGALVIKFEAMQAGDQTTPRNRAHGCRDFLTGQGWPQPILAESDAGAQLLYAIDLPKNADSTVLVTAVLDGLAAQFDDHAVHVDKGAFGPALLCPLYGLSRRSAILEHPQQLRVVERSLLEKFSTSPVNPPAVNPVEAAPMFEDFRPLPLDEEAARAFVPGQTAVNFALDDSIQRFVDEEGVLDEGAWTPTSSITAQCCPG